MYLLVVKDHSKGAWKNGNELIFSDTFRGTFSDFNLVLQLAFCWLLRWNALRDLNLFPRMKSLLSWLSMFVEVRITCRAGLNGSVFFGLGVNNPDYWQLHDRISSFFVVQGFPYSSCLSMMKFRSRKMKIPGKKEAWPYYHICEAPWSAFIKEPLPGEDLCKRFARRCSKQDIY